VAGLWSSEQNGVVGNLEASSIIFVDGPLHLTSGNVSFEVFKTVITMQSKEPFG